MSLQLPDFIAGSIRSPEDLKRPDDIILYGRPKGGKTYLAASVSDVPQFSPTLLIDTEGSSTGTTADFDSENLHILRITDFVDNNPEQFPPDQAHNEIRAFDYLTQWVLSKDFPYKAVIIDTFDVAQDWKLKEFQSRYGTSGDGVFRAWRELKDWAITLFRQLKQARPLAISVIHETVDKVMNEEQTAEINFSTLAIAGKAKEVIPGIPDIIGYVQRGQYEVEGEVQEVSLAQFASNTSKITGNRFGLPPMMVNPSMEKIMEAINAKGEKE